MRSPGAASARSPSGVRSGSNSPMPSAGSSEEAGPTGIQRDLGIRRTAGARARFRPIAFAMRTPRGRRSPLGSRRRRSRGQRIGGREARRREFRRSSRHRSQFAVVSLAKHAKRVGVVAVVLIAAVFIAMKARLAWYAVMECPAGEMGGLGDIVVSIDRYAFWLSVFLGMAGWMYIDSRRVPAAFTQEFRRQLSRFFRLCSAATGALLASVISAG